MRRLWTSLNVTTDRSTTSTDKGWAEVYLYLILVLAVVVMWILPMATSLWLDETLTYWGARDGFGDMLFRTLHLHYFSLFFWFEWVAIKIGGMNEIILRLPAVISMGLALLVLRRLVADFFDAKTATYALLVFASHPAIVNQASNARPYALGVFLSCLSMYFFMKWYDDQDFMDGLYFAIASSLAVYTHLFLCLQLVPCAVALGIAFSRGRLEGSRAIAVFSLVGLFLAPLGWWTISSYAERSHLLSWATTPDSSDFLKMVIPKQFLKSGLVCVALGYFLRVRITAKLWCPKWQLLLLFSWAIFPCLIIYFVSRTTDFKIFVEHYLISIVPSVTVLIAIFIRSCESVAGDWRRKVPVGAVFATVFLATALVKFLANHGWSTSEDWRSAVKAVQATLDSTKARCPVLFDSGLVEARDLGWLSEPLKSSYILAPLSAYPLRAEVVPLPYAMDNGRAESYCKGILARNDMNQFILVGRRSSENNRMETAFAALAQANGYRKSYLFPPEGSAIYRMQFRR